MPAQLKSPASTPADDIHSPSPKDAINKQRPPPIPKRSTFDLEPNPFEQSFARPSNDSSVRTQQNSPTAASDDARAAHSRPASVDNDRSHSPPDTQHKTVLPPLASIASPSDAHYSWAFSSSSFSNSLRSGPLSPAMLTGPQQQQAEQQPLAAFDPAAFRTGLTPRMGLTPGTGLTPLLGGPVSFPPASPNTAAFLSSVMNNNGPPSLSSVAGTITPNTLSAITGVLSGQQHHANGGHVQSPLSMSAVTAGYPSRSDANTTNGNAYANGVNHAQQNAPNGLFLLSQAHQELTKREEEQAAAAAAQMHGSTATPNGGAKRGTKRKSYESESPVSATAPVPPTTQTQAPKRTRSQTMSSNGRRASTVSIEQGEEEEEDDDDDDDGMLGGASSTSSGGQNGKKSGSQKKPETEEEKRRNFLERNRQAALKCRQRKKAWLAQLQAKVEFLQNENETLKQALLASREEITRLTSLVGSSASTANGVATNGNNSNGHSSHHNGHSHHHNGNGVNAVPPMQTGHGISSVSLASAAKSVPAMVGGGGGRYGY